MSKLSRKENVTNLSRFFAYPFLYALDIVYAEPLPPPITLHASARNLKIAHVKKPATGRGLFLQDCELLLRRHQLLILGLQLLFALGMGRIVRNAIDRA